MRAAVARILASAGLSAVLLGVTACGEADSDEVGAEDSEPPGGLDLMSYQRPERTRDELLALFPASDAPLEPVISAVDERERARIEEVTYTDGMDGKVEAWIVSPLGITGKPAGVVFAHAGGRGRDQFLAEAITLATRGVVSLLPTVSFEVLGDAEADSRMFVRAVSAQRRAVDVLVDRGVDPRRIGFVGHSWGATQAAIMSGVDPRLAAVVVIATSHRISDYIWTNLPSPPADGRSYMDAICQFDPVEYVPIPRVRQMLFQFGKTDLTMSPSEARVLFEAAAGKKEQKIYDAGHDLVSHKPAGRDRLGFLTRVLRLG